MVQKALEVNPMSGRLNNWMGNYHNTMPHRDWDMAFKYYKLAMERDPDYRSSYRNIGFYYRSTGKLDQAIPYFRKIVDLTTGVTRAGLNIELLALTYIDIGDYTSAAQVIRQTKELEPDHVGATNSDIQLQLARGDITAARDIIHRTLPANIDDDSMLSLVAFYETVIGDLDHAKESYARVAATPGLSGNHHGVNLYRGAHLSWGMLGAVNLAFLQKNSGDTRAAQELLGQAREFIESMGDHHWQVGGSRYVLAQIAAIEGNHDAAIEYVREAVEAGWTKAWFGRIDPIMADLHKDARYLQILQDLEGKLLKMREHPKMLVSNKP